MDKKCFGLVYGEQSEDYILDHWKEIRCPSFVSNGIDEEISSKTNWNLKDGDKFKVVVRIFGNNSDASCDSGGCTNEDVRTPEEDAEILESLLNRRYNGGVKVEGFSLDSPRLVEFLEIKGMIDKGAELPIATINDKIKFIGDVPLNMLKTEIEKLGLKPL